MRSIRLLLALLAFSAFTLSALAQVAGEGRGWGETNPSKSVMQRPPSPSHLHTSALGLRTGTTAAYAWHNGTYINTTDSDCLDFNTGLYNSGWITGEYTSYQDTDPGTPKVGEIYYLSAYVADVAACQSAYVDIEASLPQNTYVASQGAVYCFNNANPNGWTGSGCPTLPLASGTYGWSLNPTPCCWALAAQHTDANNVYHPGEHIEVHFPVYSTAPITANFTAIVQTADGHLNPTAQPQVLVNVVANTPSVSYPSPATTMVTNTTARSNAYVWNHFVAGDVYFDIGTTTAYTSSASTAIPATWDSGTFYQDWMSLSPGTTYHWRARLVTASGTTYGTDNNFTTSGTAAPSVRGDFDSNGTTDILWRSYISGTNALWMMTGTTKTSVVVLDPIYDASWKIVGIGDFNGDGKPDILWRNYPSGNNAIWYMNGTVKTSVALIDPLPDPAWRIEGVGDFNADGKPDILWRNYSSGTNAVWLMNGAVKTAVVVLDPIADAGWKMVGTGDFNSDGQTDILWRNYSSGTNAVWLMNGTVKTSVVLLDPLADPAWKMVGTGDFNGDGKPDILWRNYTSGTNALWLMNGTTKTSVVTIDPLNDATWKIQGIGEFETNGTER